MTDAEWLACPYPREMLGYLQRSGMLSDRKARLFVVALCRRALPLLSDLNAVRARDAVEIAERYADGLASRKELKRVADAVNMASFDESALRIAAEATNYFYRPYNPFYGLNCAEHLLPERHADRRANNFAMRAESQRQCELLRELFGFPCRPMPAIDPSLLRWGNGTVQKIAELIYTERRFEDLLVLADALEEAGCTDADILNHCRQPGEHVRGCWVVDLILGKS